jgi:hypothetical protein
MRILKPWGPSEEHEMKKSSAAAWAVLLAAVFVIAPSGMTSASADSARKVTIEVNASCQAPTEGTNYCSIRGALPGRAVDGGDITWEVVLFHDSQWRVQLQAFSEGAVECQYPLRAWGSITAPGFSPNAFNTTSPFLVGVSFADQPTLDLAVQRIRIDTLGTCG